MMTRRTFLCGLTLRTLAAPLAAEAQRAGNVPRIAFLTTTSPENSPTTEAFRRGLRDLGYVEGQNITVEWRWGRGTTERFPEFAADVVRLKVDVIVAANSPAGYAAQRATRTIPIVIPTMADPVSDGFVASIARPGGNITGLTFQSPELQGKRLQLLKEALPPVSRVALLMDVNDRNYLSFAKTSSAR
jgi:putative tryptophan/tyrosine transport system substrate-binding protein